MSKANEAADAIRRAAKKYQLFVEAAEILERIGSLEQATAEADQAKKVAVDARVAAEAAYVAAEAARAKVVDETARMRADAEAEAKSVIDAAHARAQEESKAIVKAAMDDAIAIGNDANAKASAVAGEVAKMQNQINVLTEHRAALEADVTALTETLNNAQARLAEVQAQAKRLFNAA
jgi:flagellar biosynthesis chaperone FliJ